MGEHWKTVVTDIICQQLGVEAERLSENASFVDDLGADSLDTVEMVMEIEEQFDVFIPDDLVELVRTVGDMWRELERLLNRDEQKAFL